MFELKDTSSLLTEDERFQLGEWLWQLKERLAKGDLLGDVILGEQLLYVTNDNLTKWRNYIKVLQENDWLTLLDVTPKLLGGMIVYLPTAMNRYPKATDVLQLLIKTMQQLNGIVTVPDDQADTYEPADNLSAPVADDLVATFKKVQAKHVNEPYSKVIHYLAYNGYPKKMLIDLLETDADESLTLLKTLAVMPAVLTKYHNPVVVGEALTARDYSYIKFYLATYLLKVEDENMDDPEVAEGELLIPRDYWNGFSKWHNQQDHYRVPDEALIQVYTTMLGKPAKAGNHWLPTGLDLSSQAKLAIWSMGEDVFDYPKGDPTLADLLSDDQVASLLAGDPINLQGAINPQEALQGVSTTSKGNNPLKVQEPTNRALDVIQRYTEDWESNLMERMKQTEGQVTNSVLADDYDDSVDPSKTAKVTGTSNLKDTVNTTDSDELVAQADELLEQTTKSKIMDVNLLTTIAPLPVYRYLMKLADKVTVTRLKMMEHLQEVDPKVKDGYLNRLNELSDVHTDLVSIAEDLVNPDLTD